MNGHALKELAKAWATVAHDGISRKGAGEPYINHPARMVESQYIWGWRQQTLCWLHDVIEDASDSMKMYHALRVVFPLDVVEDVLTLSRMPFEDGTKIPYQEWIEHLAGTANKDVIAVKLADLEDNMRDLKDIPGARGLETRYLRAKATLLEVYDG